MFAPPRIDPAADERQRKEDEEYIAAHFEDIEEEESASPKEEGADAEGSDASGSADMSDEERLPEASGSSEPPVEKYSAIEHEAIGNAAFQKLLNTPLSDGRNLFTVLTGLKLCQASTFALRLSPHTVLKPGEVIALAGDFFGIPEQPISIGVPSEGGRSYNIEDEDQRVARFNEAYDTLARPRVPGELQGLLEQIAKERRCLAKALEKKKRPKLCVSSSNYRYGVLTKYSSLPGDCLNSRYVDLLQTNFDHFKEQALLAYQAGHRSALRAAERAYEMEDGYAKFSLLVEAFCKELFACHFLTDLFASGHIRTPRKEIFDYVTVAHGIRGRFLIAGLLAKAMHDEDGDLGLMVASNKKATPWETYGDDCYFEKENKDARVQVVNAVIAGLQDVLDIFFGAAFDRHRHFSALDYLPHLVPEIVEEAAGFEVLEGEEVEEREHPRGGVPEGRENHFPLFKVSPDGTTVLRRKEMFNPGCEAYVSGWGPKWTLTQLTSHGATDFFRKRRGLPGNKLSEADQAELRKELDAIGALDERPSKAFCATQ